MTTSLASLPVAASGSGVSYRRYRGLEDIPGMGAANARIRAHVGLLEPIDVPAMEHRYTHLVLDGVAPHPDHRRRGLARAAIAESLRRLRAAGATSAYLSVDTDNHNRALTLYQSCGFRVASGSTSYRKPLALQEVTR